MTGSISPLDDAVGLTLVSADGGTALLRLEPGEAAVVADEEQPFLHGGALATCVDTAAWYAADSASPGGWVVSSLSLDCLRLARPEPHLVRAKVLLVHEGTEPFDLEIWNLQQRLS